MRSFLYFFVISAINSGPSRASVEPCDYPFRSPSPACWVCLKIDTPHSIHALPSSFSHEMCQKLGCSPGFFYHKLRVFPDYPRERHAIFIGAAPWTKMKLAGFSLLTSLWSSPKTSTLSPVDAGKRKNLLGAGAYSEHFNLRFHIGWVNMILLHFSWYFWWFSSKKWHGFYPHFEVGPQSPTPRSCHTLGMQLSTPGDGHRYTQGNHTASNSFQQSMDWFKMFFWKYRNIRITIDFHRFSHEIWGFLVVP